MKKPYILVIRQLGGIGDMLMLSPVFRGLKEAYPKHQIRLVTDLSYMDGAVPFLGFRNPFIDKIDFINAWEFTTERTKEMHAGYAGSAIDIMQHNLILGADKVFDVNNACLDYEIPASRSDGVKKTRSEIWAETCGVTPSSWFPIYEMPEKERAWARKEYHKNNWIDDKKNVGINLTAHNPHRSMSREQLISVVKGVFSLGFRPILIGAGFRLEGVPSLDNLPLWQTFAMVSELDAMIAVDSGLLHVAGTMGVPLVGIFGSTDPRTRMREYYGYAFDPQTVVDCAFCWYDKPCLNRDKPISKRVECLQKVPLDVTVEMVRRLLV